jgi:hypothetical protein
MRRDALSMKRFVCAALKGTRRTESALIHNENRRDGPVFCRSTSARVPKAASVGSPIED